MLACADIVADIWSAARITKWAELGPPPTTTTATMIQTVALRGFPMPNRLRRLEHEVIQMLHP